MEQRGGQASRPGEAELEQAAWEALARAHAPYSRFSVGAALETAEGELVSGCNVENASLGLGICAERVAIFAALARGLTPGGRLVVVTRTSNPTPPCGACRQVLREITPQIEVISVSAAGARRRWQVAALLPGVSAGRADDALEPRRLIAKKRDGERLSGAEIEGLVRGLVGGEVEEHQMSAFMMAVFLRGMERDEIRALTQAMAESGERLELGDIPGAKIDKHSTGGVGDKLSIPLVPLALACGLRVPMISGRGLGHTGGTLDKLESIPGYRTAYAPARLRELIESPGAFVAGQTAELVPADRIMYALRDVSATVASIPLIVSSILSKKLSAGLDGLVLDVKFGRGAFMSNRAAAEELARTLVEVAAALGLPAVALLTSMEEPIGWTIGNALEIEECWAYLADAESNPDLDELTLALGGLMVALGGRAATMRAGAQIIAEQRVQGRGLACARDWIAAQGGDPRIVDEPHRLARSSNLRVVPSPGDGYVTSIDALRAGELVVQLGGGRRRMRDQLDLGVGIRLHHKRGDQVSAGEPLMTLYLPPDLPNRAPVAGETEIFRIDDAPPVIAPRIAALVLPSGVHADPWDVPLDGVVPPARS
ncbi:MAG: thymidine phosphorylase [Candidatus Eisenbacteria sp.]|nr:thymidine phosphorylase [Candidatus Eisenbacteria bacterium]